MRCGGPVKNAVKKLVEQGITDPAVIACTLHIKRARVETALAWIARDTDRAKKNATKNQRDCNGKFVGRPCRW